MAHHARVQNGIVTTVNVVDAETLQSGHWGPPSEWVQTSYNTHAGEHPEGRPLRGNYAGIGYTYDAVNDAFYPPKPYPSWSISKPKWTWSAPKPMPIDGKMYSWDEPTLAWKEVELV